MMISSSLTPQITLRWLWSCEFSIITQSLKSSWDTFSTPLIVLSILFLIQHREFRNKLRGFWNDIVNSSKNSLFLFPYLLLSCSFLVVFSFLKNYWSICFVNIILFRQKLNFCPNYLLCVCKCILDRYLKLEVDRTKNCKKWSNIVIFSLQSS